MKFYTYILINSETKEPFYVGKGKGDRAIRHFKNVDNPKTYLHRKIAKLIKENIQINIEKIYCENEDEAFIREIHLIHKLGRRDLNLGPLLNFTDGGEGMHGHQFSQESKLKMSIARRKRITTNITKLKMSKSMTGKICSEQTKRKISQKHQGKTLTEEHRKNLSAAKKGIGLGRILSEEHKHKMSVAQKGKSRKPLSEETKLKISMGNKGKIVSQEARNKMSIAAIKREKIKHGKNI